MGLQSVRQLYRAAGAKSRLDQITLRTRSPVAPAFFCSALLLRVRSQVEGGGQRNTDHADNHQPRSHHQPPGDAFEAPEK